MSDLVNLIYSLSKEQTNKTNNTHHQKKELETKHKFLQICIRIKYNTYIQTKTVLYQLVK